MKYLLKIYIFQGIIVTAAGYFAYFSTFYALGFPPNVILELINYNYANPPTNAIPFHKELFNLGNNNLN